MFISGPPRGSQLRLPISRRSGLLTAHLPPPAPVRAPTPARPGGPFEARLPVAPSSFVLLENSFCHRYWLSPYYVSVSVQALEPQLRAEQGCLGPQRVSAKASCC